MVVLKFDFASDIRRLTCQELPSFGSVRALVTELYGEALPTFWVLKYRDDDGDSISVTCDHELADAFKACGDVLRLVVSPSDKQLPTSSSQSVPSPIPERKKAEEETADESPSSADTTNTTDTVCNGCDKIIKGPLHKCVECKDYDLCVQCYDEKRGALHAWHGFVKLSKPEHYALVQSYWRRLQVPSSPRSPRANKAEEKPRVNFFSQFVADVTINDGEVIGPGEHFIKIWRLRNNGLTAWPENTKLIFIGGATLLTDDQIEVISAKPGQEVDIAVDMFAPAKAGRYVSNWTLSYDNCPFGHKIWVDIEVKEETPKKVETENLVADKEPETPVSFIKEADNDLPDSVADKEDNPSPTVPINVIKEEINVDVPELPASAATPETPTIANDEEPVMDNVEEPKPMKNAKQTKKVDDDVPEGVIRQTLIALYDMGFTDIAANRIALQNANGDVITAVHQLLDT